MDPSPPPPRRPAPGIPRTRGDGPPTRRKPTRRKPDSPHARGWTPVGAPSSGRDFGFPARAGMDLRSARPSSRLGRIPRTRGDGPQSARRRRALAGDSPHARGWTHVGACPEPGRRRIPRTRGDGPSSFTACVATDGDSPHARGWTDALPRCGEIASGFPARAGMDPADGPGAAPPAGIPRTRGDGPRSDGTPPPPRRDSPHARGWTRTTTACAGAEDGFPARAGMDRKEVCVKQIIVRIPRTRGDGPAARPIVRGARPDSPHARGWTLDKRRNLMRLWGFPARAGMDRLQPLPHIPTDGIPRTRGDGPATSSRAAPTMRDSPHARGWTRLMRRYVAQDDGFPARAGMDPVAAGAPSCPQRIPRTRGDGPVMVRHRRDRAGDSPHARGWTRAAHADGGEPRGFPARAGMDPLAIALHHAHLRIPRTRGDGPPPPTSPSPPPRDSPHARGWTRRRRARGPTDVGFPARAGMDPACASAGVPGRWIPRTRGDGP